MQVFVVGGAVRDVVLGHPHKDIDYVVVGSTPEEMLSLGYKQVGADFPVFLCPNGDEYALARTERKTGEGYLGFETTFDSFITLADDLNRRDLTMNSMAVPLDDWEEFKITRNRSLIIDPHDGLDVIDRKVLVHTSEFFVEDPVRILRIARFHATYGFNIARSTMELMTSMVKNGDVDHLVPERIWAEMHKAIMLTNAMKFFWVLHRCGALNIIIPGMSKSMVIHGISFRSATLREHSLGVRMMLLFGYLEDPQDSLLQLKAPSSIIEQVVMFKRAEALITSVYTSEDILDFLKQIKDPNLLYTISSALNVTSFTKGIAFDNVISGYNATKFISFKSLSDEQQTLKGADIGKAINALKAEAITMDVILS